MNFFHSFGKRDDEVVVASVVLLATEMLGCEILDLQAGAHCAVEDKHFLFEGVEVTAICVFSIHSAPKLPLCSSINLFTIVISEHNEIFH